MLRNAVGGGCQLSQKKGYEGVRFNIISVPRGVGAGKISRKKALRTLERPLAN